jgi:hypothetical protein
MIYIREESTYIKHKVDERGQRAGRDSYPPLHQAKFICHVTLIG